MSMISLNTPLPSDLPTTLADLLTLIADPVASKERLTQMQTAAAEMRAAAESSKAERTSFAAAHAEHNAAIDKATSEHNAKLAADRSEFEALVASRTQRLDERDAAISQLSTKAKSDAAAAATLRADVERRLAQIRLATGLT